MEMGTLSSVLASLFPYVVLAYMAWHWHMNRATGRVLPVPTMPVEVEDDDDDDNDDADDDPRHNVVAPLPDRPDMLVEATGRAIEAAIRAATTPFTAPATTDLPPLTPAEIAKVMEDMGVSDLEWMKNDADPFDGAYPAADDAGTGKGWFQAGGSIPTDDDATLVLDIESSQGDTGGL